jgi:hypothetical protein
MAQAPRDENFVPSMLFVGSDGETYPVEGDKDTGRIYVDLAVGSGTVTSVSVVTDNGFAGTVADPTTTPAITLSTTETGILQGNGTAISPITVGTGLTFSAGTLSADNNGDVVGPASSTDDAIVRFNGTTGKIIQDYTSGAPTISDTGAVNIPLTTGSSLVVDTSTFVVDATNNRVGVNNASPAVALDLVGQFQQYFNGVLVTDTPTIGGTMFGLSIRGTGLEIAGIQTNTTGDVKIGAFRASYNPVFWANNVATVKLIATALHPVTNDLAALGTTALQWSDLFLAEGGVINWDNGDVTMTQTGNVLAVAGGDLRVATADVGTNADSVPTLSSTSTLTNKTLTAPIVSVPVELTSDDTYSGDIRTGILAGDTIAQWDLVYLDSSSGRWELADADAAATAGGVLLGLALTSGTDGNALTVLVRGVVRNDGWSWATVGGPLYVSTTPAAITQTAPSGTDDVIRIVGYAWSDDQIEFCPSNDWITHT